MSSANGAFSARAWGNAPGFRLNHVLALKARLNRPSSSIPHILLIKLDAVLAQQLSVFFLKGVSAMMLFLSFHIFQDSIELLGLTEKIPYPRCQKKPR